MIDLLLSLLQPLSLVRAVVGAILVFFLPGFAWTLVFFREINIVERIALSIGLSIALLTVSVVAANKVIGLTISGVNALLFIFVLTIIPLVIFYLNRRRQQE